VCRLQDPGATGAHNQCFQQVQEDMSKARSTCKDRARMGGGRSNSSVRTSFGQGKRVVRVHEDVWDKRRGREKIIYRLGSLLLSEHEKLFGSYWRKVFGPPSSLMHLLGKDLSVRASNSL
jgi:hypothetical protein